MVNFSVRAQDYMTNLGIKKSDTAPFYGTEDLYLNSTMQNTTTVASAADNRISLSKYTINVLDDLDMF